MKGWLYKYTCSPNYPVLSRATLVFIHDQKPKKAEDALHEARRLATEQGFCKVGECETFELLGELKFIHEQQPQIIISESGEY